MGAEDRGVKMFVCSVSPVFVASQFHDLKQKKKSCYGFFFWGVTTKAHELYSLSDTFGILLLTLYMRKGCLGSSYLK